MGGQPYSYYIKYSDDVDEAFESLRQQEFQAGRYYPANRTVADLPDQGSEFLTPQHSSIEQAILDAGETGTRSILDLSAVSDKRAFCVATRLSDEELLDLYDTTQPTHAMIESSFPVCERGQGVCIIVYKDNKPDEIFFGGCSFD